jgi:hypothetical protein
VVALGRSAGCHTLSPHPTPLALGGWPSWRPARPARACFVWTALRLVMKRGWENADQRLYGRNGRSPAKTLVDVSRRWVLLGDAVCTRFVPGQRPTDGDHV